MKNLKKTLACLLTAAMVAGLGAISVSAAPTRVEVESGTTAGAALVVNTGLGEDVSEGAWVGSLGQGEANSVEVTVTATTAGKKTLTIGYNTMGDRSVEVSVNGGEAIVVTTPGGSASWTTGILTVTVEVTLNEGENTIKMYNSATGDAGWAPNLDYIEIEDVAGGETGGEGETDGKQEQPGENDGEVEDKPSATGDATLVAVALAVVALAGAAVVSKKRHTAE